MFKEQSPSKYFCINYMNFELYISAASRVVKKLQLEQA